MWFVSRRSLGVSHPREGKAVARRESMKFGPRAVEMLEVRALLSKWGHRGKTGTVHALARHQTRFVQTNLVSDGAVPAKFTDPKLVNPWGLAASKTSPWWVNDNGTGFSTLYNGTGVKQALEVTVPPPTGSPAGTTSTPTGMVFNGKSSEFLVNGPGTAAHFIFSTEDGTISGWNAGTSAVLKVDNSGSGAVYKGLALANNGGADFLYATNFHAGTVDVFDSSYHQVTLASGAFTDSRIP